MAITLGGVNVHLSQAAIDGALNDWEGPVGRMIIELSDEITTVAKATVRVRNPHSKAGRAGPNSTAHPPGYTKALTRRHLGKGSRTGTIYGGANAPGSPGLFLEYPAIQIALNAHRFPFLTTGLDAIEGRF